MVCIMVCNGMYNGMVTIIVCNIGSPFIDCRRETNKSKIANATDIDAVMQMHNLI